MTIERIILIDDSNTFFKTLDISKVKIRLSIYADGKEDTTRFNPNVFLEYTPSKKCDDELREPDIQPEDALKKFTFEKFLETFDSSSKKLVSLMNQQIETKILNTTDILKEAIDDGAYSYTMHPENLYVVDQDGKYHRFLTTNSSSIKKIREDLINLCIPLIRYETIENLISDNPVDIFN